MPQHVAATPLDVTIRLWQPTDSIEELTDLLHRAYRPLADMGMNFTAINQSPQNTRDIIAHGECYVALANERIIGTCLLNTKKQPYSEGSPWLDHPMVLSHTQLAVDPDLPAMGIARLLHERVEQRAKELGASEVALDTAEQATHLVRLYQWTGYRIVDTAYHIHTNYRSVIMCKRLRDDIAVQIDEPWPRLRHTRQRMRRLARQLRASWRAAVRGTKTEISHTGTHATSIRVVIQHPNLTKYRLPVFQALATRPGIDLMLAYGPGKERRLSQAQGFKSTMAPMIDLHWGGRQVIWHWPQWRYADPSAADVLILEWDLHYLSLIPGLLRARINGVGTIIWGHGYSKRHIPWRAWARAQVAKLADILLFYNHSASRGFLDTGWPRDRVFIALNSLDQRPIQQQRQQWANRQRVEEFANQQQINDGPVVLFVSRLQQANRVDLLIRATQQLVAKHPSLHLLIIGDGPHEPHLRSLANSLSLDDNVRFLGAIFNEAEIAPWFMCADVFCYPENIGLSLLHAFGYGLPVVTSDHIQAHNPEIEALEHGRNGLLYRDGNVDDLADKLDLILSNPQRRKEMANSALATVSELFTLDQMVDQIEAAIRRAYQCAMSR